MEETDAGLREYTVVLDVVFEQYRVAHVIAKDGFDAVTVTIKDVIQKPNMDPVKDDYYAVVAVFEGWITPVPWGPHHVRH